MEHHIYLTNEQGDQASVAWLRILTDDREAAISVARNKGLKNFNVVKADGDNRYLVAWAHDGKINY